MWLSSFGPSRQERIQLVPQLLKHRVRLLRPGMMNPVSRSAKGTPSKHPACSSYKLEIEAGGTLAPRGVVILDRGMKLSQDAMLNMEPDAMLHVKDGILEVSVHT